MKTVDQHSTKDEEIKHLHSMASTCKPGSYLADLFTPLLIARVETAIKNDTPPDIQGELEAEIMRGITKNTVHHREIDNLKHETRKLNDRTYSLEIDVQQARETARHYQQEAESLRNQWSDLVHERAELIGTIACLTRELETIKARQPEAAQI